VISADGSHKITYYSSDNAGNIETTNTGYVNIETTNPTTAQTNLQAGNNVGWTNVPVTVTLTPADTGGSGLASTMYKIDGGSPIAYTVPFVVSSVGSHTITYYSTDNAGNVEVTKTGYVNIDTALPTTAQSGLQAANNVGWTNVPVTVTLTPADTGGSGLASTMYKIDAATPVAYTVPFVVSGVGQHTVTYYSTDNAGNVEATNAGYVNIETTSPVTTASGLQADNHSGWRTTSQSVTLTAADTGGSGMLAVTYTLDGGAPQFYSNPFTVAGDASHTVTYYATDAAGNVEATKTGYVNIDSTKPLTTATGLQATSDSGWALGAQNFTLAASDGGSGIAATYYTLDGRRPADLHEPGHGLRSGQPHHHLLVGRQHRQRRGCQDRLCQPARHRSEHQRRRSHRLAQRQRHSDAYSDSQPGRGCRSHLLQARHRRLGRRPRRRGQRPGDPHPELLLDQRPSRHRDHQDGHGADRPCQPGDHRQRPVWLADRRCDRHPLAH